MEGHSSSSTVTEKRARGEDDSPGLKRFKESDSFLTRNDSSVSVVSQVDSGNGGDCGDELAPPEVVKIRDMLDILEEPETVPETQELDSVIRSFEEEILRSGNVQVTSFPDEVQPDLGFLLGASDDELGLPPSSTTAVAVGEESKTEPEPVELGNALDDVAGFQDELLPGYDLFELDIVEGLTEGLFDEVEFSDLGSWQLESLPAV